MQNKKPLKLLFIGKLMKKREIFLIFALIAGIFLMAFLQNPNYTGRVVFSGSKTGGINVPVVSENVGFPHYLSSELHYSFVNEKICGRIEAERIRRAFAEIETQSGFLKFTETDNANADILATCSKKILLGREPGYVISGRGSYSYVGNRIIKGRILFYNCEDRRCSLNCPNFPDVEVHEILHVLGIKHSASPNSIMYSEVRGCKYKIDEEIISTLRDAYNV